MQTFLIDSFGTLGNSDGPKVFFFILLLKAALKQLQKTKKKSSTVSVSLQVACSVCKTLPLHTSSSSTMRPPVAHCGMTADVKRPDWRAVGTLIILRLKKKTPFEYGC